MSTLQSLIWISYIPETYCSAGPEEVSSMDTLEHSGCLSVRTREPYMGTITRFNSHVNMHVFIFNVYL